MNLGFTGTRNGMTDAQKMAFEELVVRLTPWTFRHGSCRGADVEAARIVDNALHDVAIVAHPGPDGDPNRASSGVDTETLPGKTHFARNRDIVNLTDALAACPPCRPLPERGGTSYTVGYARKKGKPVYIIWPDGTVEDCE